VLPAGGLSVATSKSGEFHTIGLSVAAFKFGEFHTIGLSVATSKSGEFHTIGLSVVAFKFGEYRAANAVCINAIQSSTPTNMGTALITLFLLMFSTPFGWYHILNSVI
jgi:hypothetical protein